MTAIHENNNEYCKPDFNRYPITGYSQEKVMGTSGYLYDSVRVFDPVLGRDTWQLRPIERGPGNTCYPCTDKD